MSSADSSIIQALNLYTLQRYDEAEQLSKQLLDSGVGDMRILLNLGNIYFIKKDYSQAIDFYHQALVLDSNYFPALVNLANTYFEQKKYVDSLHYSELSLAQNPKHFQALFIKGNTLLEQERIPAALACLIQAAKLDSQDVWVHNSLSRCYQKIEDYKQAIEEAYLAVNLSKGEDSQHINLGYLLYETSLEKGKDFVIPIAKKWAREYPKNSIVNYLGQALVPEQKIKKADSAYIENVFDIFAADFEAVLTELDYKVPTYMEQILASYLENSSFLKMRILDAGCGTGFCGKFLKKYAQQGFLHGVDLSANMLEVAASKKLYDKLENCDLVEYLQTNKASFDLIAAADVFTYFGDVEELFSSLNDSLNPRGILIFSVSQNTINKDDYFLHPSARFLHTDSYIKRLLKKQGFFIKKQLDSILRQEGDNGVSGIVYLVQKT